MFFATNCNYLTFLLFLFAFAFVVLPNNFLVSHQDEELLGKHLEDTEMDALSSSHPVTTPTQSPVHLCDKLDKVCRTYLKFLLQSRAVTITNLR